MARSIEDHIFTQSTNGWYLYCEGNFIGPLEVSVIKNLFTKCNQIDPSPIYFSKKGLSKWCRVDNPISLFPDILFWNRRTRKEAIEITRYLNLIQKSHRPPNSWYLAFKENFSTKSGLLKNPRMLISRVAFRNKARVRFDGGQAFTGRDNILRSHSARDKAPKLLREKSPIKINNQAIAIKTITKTSQELSHAKSPMSQKALPLKKTPLGLPLFDKKKKNIGVASNFSSLKRSYRSSMRWLSRSIIYLHLTLRFSYMWLCGNHQILIRWYRDFTQSLLHKSGFNPSEVNPSIYATIPYRSQNNEYFARLVILLYDYSEIIHSPPPSLYWIKILQKIPPFGPIFFAWHFHPIRKNQAFSKTWVIRSLVSWFH